MDIFQILHIEHVEAQSAVERLQHVRGRGRRELLGLIVDELTAHTGAEERVLYDRLPGAQIALEGKEEHFLITRLLEDLVLMRVDDERFEAKTKVLGEILRHHVAEEESELWAEARRQFEPFSFIAEELGGEYVALKCDLQRRPSVVRLGTAHAKKLVDDVGHVFAPR